MYFIAHVENWDENKRDSVEEKILLAAHNFPDATQIIINYCGDTLERITLLEPITDNSVIVLDDIAETCIRKESANGF